MYPDNIGSPRKPFGIVTRTVSWSSGGTVRLDDQLTCHHSFEHDLCILWRHLEKCESSAQVQLGSGHIVRWKDPIELNRVEFLLESEMVTLASDLIEGHYALFFSILVKQLHEEYRHSLSLADILDRGVSAWAMAVPIEKGTIVYKAGSQDITIIAPYVLASIVALILFALILGPTKEILPRVISATSQTPSILLGINRCDTVAAVQSNDFLRFRHSARGRSSSVVLRDDRNDKDEADIFS